MSRVATPGGVTEKGLKVLEDTGLRDSFDGAVDLVVEASAVTLLAITRGDVADYVYTLALVYVVLIFVQVIVSFIPRMPYNRFLSAFLGFVGDVVNPYLQLVARACCRWSGSGRGRWT